MLAKCFSAALVGVDAVPVEIEVFSTSGVNSFAIVGLPDQAVKESKDRIPSALKVSGFRPNSEFSITVNLAPASVRKEGPIYDLPIAVCLLKAIGKIHNEHLDEIAMVGELSLSGAVRPVRGVLPIAMEMKRIGKRAMIVPIANADEASVVEGIDIIPVRTLIEAVGYLNGELDIEPYYMEMDSLSSSVGSGEYDFENIKGQKIAKRAIEIAVAGGHNILMIGSPGAGKTLLARSIPSILPPMTTEEALEVTKIHSIAGVAKGGGKFVTERPFRAPHHTVSNIGLLGGGAHPLPGEVSLAHRGVLFLDEFAEFSRSALEVLRQPLEDGHVTVSRAAAACDYPSRFMLVAAMNPCPCGHFNDDNHQCRCTPNQVARYQARVSGPVLDRIDIHVGLSAVSVKDLNSREKAESSVAVRERVLAARAIQSMRYSEVKGAKTNADIKGSMLREACRISEKCAKEMEGIIERMNLSARSYDRILRVARTIADLKAQSDVKSDDIKEAAMYRELDRNENSFWM